MQIGIGIDSVLGFIHKVKAKFQGIQSHFIHFLSIFSDLYFVL